MTVYKLPSVLVDMGQEHPLTALCSTNLEDIFADENGTQCHAAKDFVVL